jgi:hypothetical protein
MINNPCSTVVQSVQTKPGLSTFNTGLFVTDLKQLIKKIVYLIKNCIEQLVTKPDLYRTKNLMA